MKHFSDMLMLLTCVLTLLVGHQEEHRIRPVKTEWCGTSMVLSKSEVQMICIWSSWCHFHGATPSSLASLKSRLV